MTDSHDNLNDDMLDEMLGDFIDEAEGLLSQLSDNVLELDEQVKALSDDAASACDHTLLNEMFRAAHSIKGLSAMMRLHDINRLTHKLENVFDAARQEQLPLSPEAVELIFSSLDLLGSMISNLKDASTAVEVDVKPVTDAIRSLLQAHGVDKEMGSQSSIENALNEIQQQVEQAADDNDSREDVMETPFQEIADEHEIQPNFLAIFIDESLQSIEDLSELLLGESSPQAVESLLVTCHRIKGSAASIGLNRAAKLAHLMEDVLQDLLADEQPLVPEVNDAMFLCTDALRNYVECLKSDKPTDDQFPQAYETLWKSHRQTFQQTPTPNNPSAPAPQLPGALDPDSMATVAEARKGAVASGATPPASSSSPTNPQTTEAIRRLAASFAADMNGVVVQVEFEPELMLVDLKARLILERAADLGRVHASHPQEEELAECDLRELLLALETSQADESICKRLALEGVCSIQVHRPASTQTSEPTSEATPTPSVPTAVDQQVAHGPAARVPTPASPTDANAEDAQRTSSPESPTTPAAGDARSSTLDDSTPAASGGGNPTTRTKPAETLRVDIDRLDQLMNLAGQLVINKARFVQISTGLRPLHRLKQMTHALSESFTYLDRIESELSVPARELDFEGNCEEIKGNVIQLRDDLHALQNQMGQLADLRGLIGDLGEAVHQLDRVADGIQKSVMDTRMVPIGPLFSRFKRVIRDLTRTTKKEVQLEIRGEKTELDKCMIDKLGDPLIHMVRNSVDHGIESPDDRVAAGKPRQGTVSLDAFHRGNRIVIQIKDDGRGLSSDRIRRKAIEKGIVSAVDAEKLTPSQIYQLIWEPGFSTAEQITEVSGRGMGMDIVRSKIEELNGTVEVESEPGQGTYFTIRLPLTMAILPSLLANINGDVFAIPVESVVEIIRVKQNELSTVRGQVTAMVRGRVISIVRLDELLTWHRQPSSDETSDDEVTLVVIGSEGREAGLLVHGLIGEQDIVIKSLAENYRNVAGGVAGASILGDGRVSLILDVGTLLEMSCRPRLRSESSRPPEDATTSSERVSLT